MFDIAWSELLLVLIVAIVVVGPKELPGLMRTAGRMLGKLRRTADDFRKQFDEAVKEAGGEDLQREIHSLRQNNPLTQIRSSIEEVARESYSPRTGTLPPSAVEADAGAPPPLPPRESVPSTDAVVGLQPEDAVIPAAPPVLATEAASPAPLAPPVLAPAPHVPAAPPLPAAPPVPATEAAPPAPASAPKDLSDSGPGPETRINGEHRPAS
jgi:sec-independent protein translocase protein TatB